MSKLGVCSLLSRWPDERKKDMVRNGVDSLFEARMLRLTFGAILFVLLAQSVSRGGISCL